MTEACARYANRPLASSPGGNGMPRLASGLATRTRRPRPSEKTTPRAISGFAPVRPSRLRLAISRRGGLRTPAMTPLASPEHLPVRPPAVRLPSMIMLCLGLRQAFQSGRAERVRSEKIAFCVMPGFSPEGHPSLEPPAEGRAPHARKNCMTPTHMSPPFGHQPFARPSVIMTSPGLRPARTCGRAERVPCMYNTLAVG